MTFHALDGAVSPSITFPQSAVLSEASHVAPRPVEPILTTVGRSITIYKHDMKLFEYDEIVVVLTAKGK